MPGKRNTNNMVSEACLHCRVAHRKCDVGNPCKRCVSMGLECVADSMRTKPGSLARLPRDEDGNLVRGTRPLPSSESSSAVQEAIKKPMKMRTRRSPRLAAQAGEAEDQAGAACAEEGSKIAAQQPAAVADTVAKPSADTSSQHMEPLHHDSVANCGECVTGVAWQHEQHDHECCGEIKQEESEEPEVSLNLSLTLSPEEIYGIYYSSGDEEGSHESDGQHPLGDFSLNHYHHPGFNSTQPTMDHYADSRESAPLVPNFGLY